MAQTTDTYMLQMRTSVAGIPWEHRFSVSTEERALDHVRNLLDADNLTRNCTSVCLWRIAEPLAESILVREFKLPSKIALIETEPKVQR